MLAHVGDRADSEGDVVFVFALLLKAFTYCEKEAVAAAVIVEYC